jgi:hypothetical protein
MEETERSLTRRAEARSILLVEVDMSNRAAAPARSFPVLPALALTVGLFACSVYANLSFAVNDHANYRFFPPFIPHFSANANNHLGAEYLNIARSLVRGEGFANPFKVQTGPTAWMPPVLPLILAGFLWVAEGDLDAVVALVIFAQIYALALTGILVLAVARRTTTHLGGALVASVFFVGVLCNFHLWFQFTHDYWLILLAVDALIAGLLWLRPLHSQKAAAAWGLFGGTCALINPIVAFTWGVLTLALAARRRAWSHLAVAGLCAGLTLAPWAIRNYLVFGRLIPVKSNAAYELYQSQCLQPDGLLQGRTFGGHPYTSGGPERQEYMAVGEIVFLDKRRELFWRAVAADPEDFLDRVASRVLGTTLWYVPFNRDHEDRRPLSTWGGRLTHPLPFLGFLVLAFSAVLRPLQPAQWIVMGTYTIYLLPYMAISYYERYAMPLLGVKILLVIWGADRLLSLWPPKQTVRVEQEEESPSQRANLAKSGITAPRRRIAHEDN